VHLLYHFWHLVETSLVVAAAVAAVGWEVHAEYHSSFLHHLDLSLGVFLSMVIIYHTVLLAFLVFMVEGTYALIL
jgi:hypothetical protein